MVKFYLKVELRRIEGILLQEALLGNLERETLQKTRELTFKLINRIPDVVRSMLINQRLRGKVLDIGRDFVLLKLENGEEVLVRNALSVGLEKGEEVLLELINKNPYVLRVVSSGKVLRATASILRSLGNLRGYTIKQLRSFRGFVDSGLFYERKLLKAVLKGNFHELFSDLKYKAIVENNREGVELITLLQLFTLEQGNRKLFLPIREEERRGGLLVKKLRRGFKFLIELSFKDDVLLVEISSVGKVKRLNLKFMSNSEELLSRLGDFKELKKTLPIGKIEKEVLELEELRKVVIREFYGERVLNLKV